MFAPLLNGLAGPFHLPATSARADRPAQSRRRRFMKQFLLTLAGVFAGLVLFFVVIPFALIGMIAGALSKPTPTPGQQRAAAGPAPGAAPTRTRPAPSRPCAPSSPSVLSIEQTLRAAEKDDRDQGSVRAHAGGRHRPRRRRRAAPGIPATSMRRASR